MKEKIINIYNNIIFIISICISALLYMKIGLIIVFFSTIINSLLFPFFIFFPVVCELMGKDRHETEWDITGRIKETMELEYVSDKICDPIVHFILNNFTINVE